MKYDNKTELDKSEADNFEASVNQRLDQSVENLTPDIRRALNQARFNAVKKRSNRQFYFKFATAASVIFTVTLGWQVMNYTNEDSNNIPALINVADLKNVEQVATNLTAEIFQEDLEMIADLEFVYWMTEELDIEDSEQV